MKETDQLKTLQKIIDRSDLVNEEIERILSAHKKLSKTMNIEMHHQKEVQVYLHNSSHLFENI